MQPIPVELRARAARWEDLSRSERADLGRALRGHGLSYGEITAVVPVAKGTLAYWCRDVPLTDEQRAAIVERTGSRAGVPRDTQRRRRVEVEQIRSAARAEVPALSRDPLWVAGVCLYWGEGGKSARRLEMSNADPRLLLSFLKWIRRYHDPSCDVVLSLNLHAANDELEARAHWRRALGLPMAPFTKSFIKPEGTGHRKNHLAYGVCRVRLRKSADPWIRTMAWVDRLSAQLVASPEASLASNSGR